MPKENGIYEVPTLYNIAGSSNFYNKTDNGICVYRDFQKGITTVYRQKIKFDHWGVEGFSEYTYDIPSKRYFANGVPDNTNWITKLQVQPKIEFSMPINNNFLTIIDEEDPF
jgi:twinkle protein